MLSRSLKPVFRPNTLSRAFTAYDIKTLHRADTNPFNVPLLPLPEPSQTVNRLLETLNPLVSGEDETKELRALADDFLNSEHLAALQAHLRELEAKPSNGSYIEEYWNDMYYGGRSGLMVHVNPYFMLNDEADMDQVSRAARFSRSCLRFWRKTVQNKLEPDAERDGTLLDGYQYPLLFGTKRVASLTRDEFYPQTDATHVVVLCNHEYFKLEVIAPNGDVLSEEAMKKEFRNIQSQASKGTREGDIGIITHGNRSFYKEARDGLELNPTNKASLEEIDGSLFVVVLEDVAPVKVEEKSAGFLHGIDGSNRFYDKHQVIVNKDGKLGMCFEHGCNDGLTWNRMLAEVWADMQGLKPPFSPLGDCSKDASSISPSTPLRFELGNQDVERLQQSLTQAKAQVDDVDTAVSLFNDFGRNEIKTWKMSPDAVMQMAFQLTYTKIHGEVGPTYEACAMKHFFHGRTETIRALTDEAKAMTEAFVGGASADVQRELLGAACKRHIEVAVGARSCEGPSLGVDRHMFAMATSYNDLALPKHALFSHPTVLRSSDWVLSTSNVTTPFYDLFGFGAVTPKGYGLGYMTLADSLPTNVTCFKHSGNSAGTFVDTLEKVLKDDFKKLF